MIIVYILVLFRLKDRFFLIKKSIFVYLSLIIMSIFIGIHKGI